MLPAMAMVAETGLLIGRGKSKKDASAQAAMQGCLALGLVGFMATGWEAGDAQGNCDPPPLYYRLPKRHAKDDFSCSSRRACSALQGSGPHCPHAQSR